jgi:hypothetical protein
MMISPSTALASRPAKVNLFRDAHPFADPTLVVLKNAQGRFQHIESFLMIESRLAGLLQLGDPFALPLDNTTRFGNMPNGHFEQRFAPLRHGLMVASRTRGVQATNK